MYLVGMRRLAGGDREEGGGGSDGGMVVLGEIAELGLGLREALLGLGALQVEPEAGEAHLLGAAEGEGLLERLHRLVVLVELLVGAAQAEPGLGDEGAGEGLGIVGDDPVVGHGVGVLAAKLGDLAAPVVGLEEGRRMDLAGEERLEGGGGAARPVELVVGDLDLGQHQGGLLPRLGGRRGLHEGAEEGAGVGLVPLLEERPGQAELGLRGEGAVARLGEDVAVGLLGLGPFFEAGLGLALPEEEGGDQRIGELFDRDGEGGEGGAVFAGVIERLPLEEADVVLQRAGGEALQEGFGPGVGLLEEAFVEEGLQVLEGAVFIGGRRCHSGRSGGRGGRCRGGGCGRRARSRSGSRSGGRDRGGNRLQGRRGLGPGGQCGRGQSQHKPAGRGEEGRAGHFPDGIRFRRLRKAAAAEKSHDAGRTVFK